MNLLVVLMLVLVGLLTTAMASRGSWVQRRQEKRTDSCSDVRIFNRKLQVCLKAARTQNRILEENSVESKETIKELEIKNNVSMETIKELEIKNQNLVVEAKQYDAEKHHCMVNNDILEGEIKRLKEQIESDPCLSVSCGPFGTCYSNGASYICGCFGGWSGPSCNVSPLDCDFEVNECTWLQSDTDISDWIRYFGNTQTPNTGPNGDHTTGNGYYMYIESSDFYPGARADLVSTLLAPGQTYCMEIALNMYGANIRNIYVDIKIK